jgi:hypothetical protein
MIDLVFVDWLKKLFMKKYLEERGGDMCGEVV